MSVVRSKLQREILKLYRDLLRTVSPPRTSVSTPSVSVLTNLNDSDRAALRESIKSEFRRQALLYKRTDILQIEAALRRGQRRLEDLQSGTVQRVARIGIKHPDTSDNSTDTIH